MYPEAIEHKDGFTLRLFPVGWGAKKEQGDWDAWMKNYPRSPRTTKLANNWARQSFIGSEGYPAAKMSYYQRLPSSLDSLFLFQAKNEYGEVAP